MTNTNYFLHNQTNLSDLPQELYHEITSHLPGDLATLSALCSTSRQLCVAAQPVLFRDFSSKKLQTHLLFMHTIIKCDRLAGMVREYKLVTQEVYHPVIWALLAKGIGRMRNLARLAVRNYSKVRLDTSKFLGFCFPPPGPEDQNDPEGRYNYTTALLAFSWCNAYHLDEDRAVFQFLKRAKGLRELDLECRSITSSAAAFQSNICANLVSIRGNFHFINAILPRRPHIREIHWVGTKTYLHRERRGDEEALLVRKDATQMYANVQNFKLCNRQSSVARPRKMAFDKVVSELVGLKVLHIEVLRTEDLQAIISTKPPLTLEILIIDKLYETLNPRFKDEQEIVKNLFMHLPKLQKMYIRGYRSSLPMPNPALVPRSTVFPPLPFATTSTVHNFVTPHNGIGLRGVMFGVNVGVLRFPPPALGPGPLTLGNGEDFNMEDMLAGERDALRILQSQIVVECTTTSRSAPVPVPVPIPVVPAPAPGTHLAVPPSTHPVILAAMPPLIDIGFNANGNANRNVAVFDSHGLPVGASPPTPTMALSNTNAVVNLNSSTIAELEGLFPVLPIPPTPTPTPTPTPSTPTIGAALLHTQRKTNEHVAPTCPATGSGSSPCTPEPGVVGISTPTSEPKSMPIASSPRNTNGPTPNANLDLNMLRTRELDTPAVAPPPIPTITPGPRMAPEIVNDVGPICTNETHVQMPLQVHQTRLYMRSAGRLQQEGTAKTKNPRVLDGGQGVQHDTDNVLNIPVAQKIPSVQTNLQSPPVQPPRPLVTEQQLPFTTPKQERAREESQPEVDAIPEVIDVANLQSPVAKERPIPQQQTMVLREKERMREAKAMLSISNEKLDLIIDGLLLTFIISVVVYVGYQWWIRAAPLIFKVALVAFCVDTCRKHGTIFGMTTIAGCLLGCLMITWWVEGYALGNMSQV